MWIVLHLAAALSFAQPIITTIAGSERGYAGDGGPAHSASFSLASIPNPCDPGRFEQISHLSIDPEDNLYLADSNNHRIRRINTNAIAPGYFATNNTAALQADEDRNAAILARIPAARWGKPSDIGGAAVFLASSASDYVNGAIIPVDGGWLAR